MTMAKKQDHLLESIALAYVRCSCGWSWKNEELRGQGSERWRSDEDLSAETYGVFEDHKRKHA